MRIVELLGKALRPLRSSDDKLLDHQPAVAAHPETIVVTSQAFKNGGNIPIEYSCDGEGLFPALRWMDLPQGYESVILVVEDPDAPKTIPFVHGIVYNIPHRVKELSDGAVKGENLKPEYQGQGLKMGRNSPGKPAYMPPTPPPGHGPHHYHFQIIAVDTMLNFGAPPTLSEITDAISGHVLSFGEIVGIYER